jgi:hypothetical protein
MQHYTKDVPEKNAFCDATTRKFGQRVFSRSKGMNGQLIENMESERA